MSKVVGYARVSSHEQNLDRQIQALSQYVKPDMIVSEKASGREVNATRSKGETKWRLPTELTEEQVARILATLSKKELQYFKDNGIRIKIIDLPTTMAEMPQEQAWIADMVSNIMIEVLTSIAESERATIRKRQREGLDVMPIDEATGKRISRKTGRAIGRPRAQYPDNWQTVYERWANKEITARKAMQLMNLKPNTFYKLASEYKTAGIK